MSPGLLMSHLKHAVEFHCLCALTGWVARRPAALESQKVRHCHGSATTKTCCCRSVGLFGQLSPDRATPTKLDRGNAFSAGYRKYSFPKPRRRASLLHKQVVWALEQGNPESLDAQKYLFRAGLNLSDVKSNRSTQARSLLFLSLIACSWIVESFRSPLLSSKLLKLEPRALLIVPGERSAAMYL